MAAVYKLAEPFTGPRVSESSDTGRGRDDQELVRRHLQGDPEAFRVLYEKYRD